MTKPQSIILRISGIVFFTGAISCLMEVLERNIGSFLFLIQAESTAWGLFYVLTAALLVSFFVFALISCGTAAIFAGSAGYTQSVWNCSVYALLSVALFATSLIQTGIEHEEEFLLVMSLAAVVLLIVYCAVAFFCLKNTDGFSFKNIIPKDNATKLCVKVYAVLLLLIEVACFLYAHKFVD